MDLNYYQGAIRQQTALETIREFCENSYNKTIQVNGNKQLEIIQKVASRLFETSPDYGEIGSILKTEARAEKYAPLSSSEVRFYDDIAYKLSKGLLYDVIDLIAQGSPSDEAGNREVAVHAPVFQQTTNADSERQTFENRIQVMLEEAIRTLNNKDRYSEPVGFFLLSDQKASAKETFTQTFPPDQYKFDYDDGQFGQETPWIVVKKK